MASDEPVFADVSIGQAVYNEDGERLGSIRGVDDDGFYVASPSSTDTRWRSPTPGTCSAPRT